MNTPPALPELPSTAKPSWRRAFGGVWRLTYRRLLSLPQLGILAGLLVLLALLALTSVRVGNAEHFAQWSGRFYLAFAVPVIAFLTAAGLIQDDMKPATVDYVLTRPIRRHAFVFYRYFAHTACLQLQFLLGLGILVTVGLVRHIPGIESNLPSLLLAQILAVTAFSALGFAFSTFTSRYLILGILYAGIIEIGIGNIPTQFNRLSMTHLIREIATGTTEPGRIVAACVNLLVFSLVFAAIAAVIFSLRETAGSKPKDS